MEIEEVKTPYLYSIKYDGEESNEYYRLLREWSDVECTNRFLNENKTVFDGYWSNYFENTEQASLHIAKEAEQMEAHFDMIEKNTREGDGFDFDDYFEYLDGIYKCEYKYTPMKGYGANRPSLIRFYAIKIDSNVYVIADGGIKIGRKIQDSPGLKDHVIRKINQTRKFLSDLGIEEEEDVNLNLERYE